LALQCGPWAAGRRGLPEFGELAGVLGQEKTGEGSREWLGPVWALGRGGGGAGKRARRRQPVPAVAARCLAKGGSRRDCGQRGLAPGEAREVEEP
jgi:hypothetical protein